MPPQIESTVPSNENEKIEQLSLEDPNMSTSKTRKYLLILIAIQWFIFIIILSVNIYSVFLGNTDDSNSDELKSLLTLVGLVIYYTLGLLVTYKQHRIGLLIFGLIGTLIFIAICILLGYILFVAVGLSVGFGVINHTYVSIIFLSIFSICLITVGVFTLKFSFDLAKSIKGNDYTTV